MPIGADLAQARVAAGYTLDQVSESTRVRRTLLEGLERDDFAACGGDVYARGHITSYCRFVGIDPAPVLATFDADRGAVAVPEPSMTQAFATERRGAADPPRRGPNWSAAMAVALALVLLVGLVSLLTRGSGSGAAPVAAPSASGPAAPAASTTPSSSSRASSTAPSSAPSSRPTPTVLAQRPTSGVTVVLRVTGSKSWVLASNGKNGTTFYEGILDPGATRTWTDPKKVRVVVGNAGGVSLTVNGRDLGSPGADGAVVKVEFGPGDPTTSAG